MVHKFFLQFSYPPILVCIDQIPTDEWEWCSLCTLDAIDWNEEDQKEWCNSNCTYGYINNDNLGECRNFMLMAFGKTVAKRAVTIVVSTLLVFHLAKLT